MNRTSLRVRPWRGVLLIVMLLLFPLAPSASAGDFAKLVIFGDSLSDPGNYFVAFGTVSHQPFVPIPEAPYAIGGHHFSNARRGPSSSPAIWTGRPAATRPFVLLASSPTMPSAGPGHAPARPCSRSMI